MQLENHPALPQDDVVSLCKEKGIHVVAYSPLGSTGGPLLTAEPVARIAQKKGVSAGTVLLSWNGESSIRRCAFRVDDGRLGLTVCC